MALPSESLPSLCTFFHLSLECFKYKLIREPPLPVTKASLDVPTFIHMAIIHEYMSRITFFRLPYLLWATFSFKIYSQNDAISWESFFYLGRNAFWMPKEHIWLGSVFPPTTIFNSKSRFSFSPTIPNTFTAIILVIKIKFRAAVFSTFWKIKLVVKNSKVSIYLISWF